MNWRKSLFVFGFFILPTLISAASIRAQEGGSGEAQLPAIASSADGESPPADRRGDAEPASEEGVADSGNRQLFSAKPRELVLPPGSQDIIAVATLAAFLLLGAYSLVRSGAYVQTFVTFVGILTVYGGWIHHKWVISGHFPIGTGHLISLGIVSVGATVTVLGVLLLWIRCAPDNRSSGDTPEAFRRAIAAPMFVVSIFLLAPSTALFVLGVVTGHAAIFEAAPTIFGMDMPLPYLAAMTVAGCAAITGSVLFYVRALARLRLI